MITRQEVLRIARLAQLEIDEEHLDALARDLGRILEHVEQLRGLDLDGAAPGGSDLTADAGRALRVDEPHPSLPVGELQANAPSFRDGFFVVPRVLGGDS